MDIDEALAGEDEVLEAVRELMDAQVEHEQQALFERFPAERATGGRARHRRADDPEAATVHVVRSEGAEDRPRRSRSLSPLSFATEPGAARVYTRGESATRPSPAGEPASTDASVTGS